MPVASFVGTTLSSRLIQQMPAQWSTQDSPSIGEVLRLLEEARAEVRDEQTDMNKLELLRALQTCQPRNQVRDTVCCSQLQVDLCLLGECPAEEKGSRVS